MANYLATSQNIPSGTATQLDFSAFTAGNARYIVIDNDSGTDIYFAHSDTVTDTVGTGKRIKNGRATTVSIGYEDEVWIYQNSGSDARVDFSLDSNRP